MTVRTQTKVLTFRHAFRLAGLDGEQPPGAYSVEIDDERLAPLSFEAYRRIGTWIRVPVPGVAGSTQTVPVDPAELEAALARDADIGDA